ncbi:MAG: PXPV repeat protein [Herminiimonas sp.]|nr:PXPV repeat protein [Herminiimonas sp.]
MKQFRLPLISLLSASALLTLAAPAIAQVDVGVTLGYPGGYGIAQPSYVAPQPFYIQPPPVYPQRDWSDGRRQWEDQQDWREREWGYRHRYDAPHRNDNDGWRDLQRDNHGWQNGRGEHGRHNGWQR